MEGIITSDKIVPDDERRFTLNTVPFDITDLDGAVRGIYGSAKEQRGGHIHFCNAYTVACANRDPALSAVLQSSAMNLADGAAVVLASKCLGGSLRQRVAGPDVMYESLRRGSDLRHYLLGSTPATMESLIANIKDLNPEVQVVGHDCPPFRSMTEIERSAQIARLRAAKPDVVWVGLGSPKQEFEAARLAAETSVVTVAVGAAFDFIAQTRRRAPRWVRQLGLEWLYRLIQEPRRMWRRYFFGNARFIAIVAAEIADDVRTLVKIGLR